MAQTETSEDYSHLSGVYGGIPVSVKKESSENVRIVHGKEFPLVLKLEIDEQEVTPSTKKIVLKSFMSEIASRGIFLNLLRSHGAVIFRGIDVKIDDYSDTMKSLFQRINYIPFEQIGLGNPRKAMTDVVMTVNASTYERRLYGHQEFSRYKRSPAVLSFFCQKSSNVGGESTLSHASEYYERIKSVLPEFLKETMSRGLYVSQCWPLKIGPFDPKAPSWSMKHSFGKYIDESDSVEEMKRKAVALCLERACDDYEFLPDNSFKIHHHIKPLRIHPYTKEPFFYSSFPVSYGKYYDANRLGDSYQLNPVNGDGARYDDGKDIPQEVLDTLMGLSLEIEYFHKFSDGDIVFLDNYQVYHGRMPFVEGEREVFSSMWDEPPEQKKYPELLKTLR
ncbi:Piso0_004761 [Millerozyma farinosa CBS 7064]|uniref:Piso0_004761 protein n=1 Tax=Pichia sorbitophila (strain ATCC MYA-4447 / BCRC 22081 / CBS 7064 / NBRC 10061 / NRRL Y-12695) TaxID=559304 RepID=G8Y3B1_PICSO|nr:Piso0_004761 [Millerozyma farinosa CBS 7064]